jgi:hypothetical protein
MQNICFGSLMLVVWGTLLFIIFYPVYYRIKKERATDKYCKAWFNAAVQKADDEFRKAHPRFI